MSALDERVDRAADKLAELSRRAARAGGVRARLAEPLAEDSEFLRQLKPSLIAARARGEAPTDGAPTQAKAPVVEPEPDGRRPRTAGRPGGGDGPSPLLVIAAAFALGMALAHALAWLGHRYPRA